MPATPGSVVRIRERAAPKSMPMPSDDRRCSSDSAGISAIRTAVDFSEMYQSERLQFADQAVLHGRCLGCSFGLQRLRQGTR